MPLTSQAEAIRGRLRRLIPPPAPDSGWLFAFLRIIAHELGDTEVAQITSAEQQMRLGRQLTRIDAGPNNWATDPFTWRFGTINEPGAEQAFLDAWGEILSVPRSRDELDATYASRILSEITRPGTVNLGMAQTIDEATGVTGTQVLEAGDVLTVYRLNSPGLRMNAPTKRFNSAGDLPGGQTAACFVVRVPAWLQAPYDTSTIQRIANRRKAAGTRLIGVYANGAGSITAPSSIVTGALGTASVTVLTGATAYTWTLVGAAIDSGQGTSQITWHSLADGPVTLNVAVTTPTGTSRFWQSVYSYTLSAFNIVTADYQYAGTFRAFASLAGGASANTIAWTGINVDLEGALTGPTVLFDIGTVPGLATLNATIGVASTLITVTKDIKIVPYTSDAVYVSASLAPGAFVDFIMDLGWEYQLRSQATTWPACVRVYNTAADRTADALRDTATDPGAAAIVHEGIGRTILSFPLPHISLGSNGDTPRTRTAYLRMFNLDTVSRAITLTLGRTETSISGNLVGALSTSIPTVPVSYAVSQVSNLLQHIWSAGLDTQPRTFEIRVGSSWLTGTPITTVGTNQTTTLAPAPGLYTYWIAAKSAYGLYSTAIAASVTVEPADVAHDFGEIL